MKKKSTAAALLLAAVLLIPACTEQRAVQVHIGDETQESRPAEEACSPSLWQTAGKTHMTH